MNAATTNDAESAVRQYLLFLEDPNKLRDEQEIEKKTQAVSDAVDPIDKLKAIAALELASSIDEEPLRQGFIETAKAWAEVAGVPVTAFREMRVPDEVLHEAGFSVPAARGRGRASSGERQRAKAVPVEDIKGWVLEQTGTFVLTDVMSGIGGSQATVRKAVDELVEAGEVVRLGPVADYSGRGRAPVGYSRG